MKMRTAPLHALALAAMLATASPVTLASDAKAGEYYEDALQRYQKKDLQGSIIQLKNALKQDKSMLQVHLLLGKALLESGQAPAAEAAFEEAQRLGVNRAELVLLSAQAFILQGKLSEVADNQKFPLTGLSPTLQAQLLLVKAGSAADMGDPKAALKLIDDARALDPINPDGWLAEVPMRIRAREFPSALNAIDKAKTLSAKPAELAHQTASVLHAQGNLKGALEAYGRALQLQPDFSEARIARAGLLVDLKRDAAAAGDVAVLLQDSPIEPRAWYLNALLADRAGKAAAAKSSLTKITELMDAVPLASLRYRPQLLMLTGQAHYGLNEREKAKLYFEAYAKLQPGSPITKLLANIYIAEGNEDRAVQSLEQHLAAVPNDTQAMALLASAHMAKGRNARAAELMQRALQKSNSADIYTAYGMSLLGAGQTGNALTQLETAYKKDPNQLQAANALVNLYLLGGQVPKALSIAQALVRLQPENPSYLNVLGLAKAKSGDLPGARVAFEQVYKLDPSLLQAQMNLARLERLAKNPTRAQSLLTGITSADPFNTEAMVELAALAESSGKPDEALRLLKRAFDVAGAKDLRASLALVDLHVRAGRKAEALMVTQTLALSAPDNVQMLLPLARVQLLNGDTAGAKVSLANASLLAATDAQAQVQIALLQLDTGNVPAAADSLSKALGAKPDNLQAQALMVDVNMRLGDLAKAEAWAQQIVKRAPKLAIGHTLLGDIALARKQPAQALDRYRKAFEVEPYSETFRRLFAVQAELNPKQATALADAWFRSHPDDARSRLVVARAHVRSGNLLTAKLQYEHLRKIAPKDPQVANDLANTLLALQDPQALPVAEQALALAPTDPNVIDTAGWVAFLSDKAPRALQLLGDARLRAPESALVRYHLGAVLAKAGRKAEAADELNVALRSKEAFRGRSDAEALLRTLK